MKRGKERNEAERRHGQKEKDRGPFGLAPTEEWDKKDESEEDECGYESLESRSSFRKPSDAQGGWRPGCSGRWRGGGTETKSLSKGGKIWAVANMYSGCDGARTPEPNGN